MQTAYLVRPAETSDIPELSALRIAYLKEEFQNTDVPESDWGAIAAQLPDYFRTHLGIDCFPFVAEAPDDDRTLIALVILCTSEKPANLSFPNGKSGVVLSVYTKPEYRGMGCATKLMQALLQKAESLGLDIVNLSASDMGKPIYEKLGFVRSHSKFTEMEYIISHPD